MILLLNGKTDVTLIPFQIQFVRFFESEAPFLESPFASILVALRFDSSNRGVSKRHSLHPGYPRLPLRFSFSVPQLLSKEFPYKEKHLLKANPLFKEIPYKGKSKSIPQEESEQPAAQERTIDNPGVIFG